MKTPYEILGISPSADDSEIKRAYLTEVKNNPPDRDQEKFQLIHTAYQSIKDEKSRLSQALFTLPIADFDKLVDLALEPEEKVELNATHFTQLLSASINDSTFQNVISTPKQV